MTPSTDPPTQSSRHFRTFEQALCVVFVVLLGLNIAATIGVLFSGMPPLFNQRALYYTLGNVACVIGLLALLATLLVTQFVTRLRVLRRAVLVFIVTLLTLEGLLCVFDRSVISAAGSPMSSAFRNIWVHGEPIWLPQPNANSPYGFRNPDSPTAHESAYRILFLGSSFVHGSGSTFETNYPQVVATSLKSALPARNVEVLSAGVDGYGTKEERLLYEHLLEAGQHFDLLVVNFHMGSDFSDDIPGTLRKSVAGEPQRFPDNWFLRTFYPVDMYLLRYAYYFQITFQPRFGAVDNSGPTDATCQASGNFLNYAQTRTWLYYAPGADKRLYLESNVDDLFRIDELAKAHGARVLVVLLPDRFAVLNQPGVDTRADDLNWTRRYMQQRVGRALPMLDLTPYYENRPDLFLCNDLHWNDPGNVEGGRRVSEHLLRFIGDKLTDVPATAATSH